MQGLRGQVRSSARVIQAAAMRPRPPINEAPLQSIPTRLRREIDRGLESSRFGVVVLFKAFFGRVGRI